MVGLRPTFSLSPTLPHTLHPAHRAIPVHPLSTNGTTDPKESEVGPPAISKFYLAELTSACARNTTTSQETVPSRDTRLQGNFTLHHSSISSLSTRVLNPEDGRGLTTRVLALAKMGANMLPYPPPAMHTSNLDLSQITGVIWNRTGSQSVSSV